MLRSIALGLAGGVCVLAACVGDDPQTSAIVGIDAGFGGTSSGSVTSSSGSVADGGGEGGSTQCPAEQTACGTTCVDLQTSAANCGRCGRTCGKTTCSKGSCPEFETLAFDPDGGLTINALAASSVGVFIGVNKAVDLCSDEKGCTPLTLTTFDSDTNLKEQTIVATDKDVYWGASFGDYARVKSCPLTGCTGSGPETVDEKVNTSVGGMATGPKYVAWGMGAYYGNSVRGRLLTGSTDVADLRPEQAQSWYDDPHREMDHPTRRLSIGGKSLLWGTGNLYDDNSKQVRYCLLPDCSTPLELGTGKAFLTALTYYDGHHFMATAGDTGTTIYSVLDSNPLDVRAIAHDSNGVNDIAVDGTGLYWANTTTGEILHCADVTQDCTKPEKLAIGQKGVQFIEVGPKYVYWALPSKVLQVGK